MHQFSVEAIASIHNDYKDKFGIPRQSGLLDKNISTIVFNEKYRDENALRGLEGYSHIWLLWVFDKNKGEKSWFPTVRPPRLGGNKRMGVFATRSPYHPNGIGLSCVKLRAVEKTQDGLVLKVSGADLLDGTPIIDIKPYLSFTDSHPDALCGFAEDVFDKELDVIYKAQTNEIPKDVLKIITEILRQDPRPSYHNNSERIYYMDYSDYKIQFTVEGTLLTVTEITKE